MQSIQYQGMSLPLPAGWTDGTVLIAQGPDQGGFKASVVLARHALTPGETLAQFSARIAPGPRAKQARPARFGALEGLLREEQLSPGGRAMYHAQFHVVVGQTGYVVALTEQASRQAEASKLLGEILSNLQLPRAGAVTSPAAGRGFF